MNVNLTDLGAVLAYLAGPVGIVAWMVYVSNWFRNATEDKGDGSQLIKLTGWRLQLLIFAVSALPPTAAFLILAYVPPEVITMLSPSYQFFATLFIAYLAQQVWFAYKKTNSFSTLSVSLPAIGADSGSTSISASIDAQSAPPVVKQSPALVQSAVGPPGGG